MHESDSSSGGSLARDVFLDRPSIGTVTDLRLDPVTGGVSVAGRRGAVRLSRDGSEEWSVGFEGHAVFVEFLDPHGSREAGFFDRGGVGWQDAARFDRDGRRLWTHGHFSHPDHQGVDDMAAGDLDGSGEVGFVVGCNGDGGVLRLDGAGSVVWREPDANVWHVELVDLDGDGRDEIVHTNSQGRVVIRGGDGTTLRHSEPRVASGFSLCRWPDRTGPPRLLTVGEGRFRLSDIGGVETGAFEAPHAPSRMQAVGTAVRFEAAGPEHLAIASTDWRESSVTVFADGQIVRHDAFGRGTRRERLGGGLAVLAVPGEDGRESLLVGGDGVVWRYRAS